MNARPPRVVVLGGGTAGWITACLLHKRWAGRGGSVTVVESPQIGIIGVGEGSTPQLKAFFDELGIEEAEWMTACDATYKLGIRFTGWSAREAYGSYFHPFPGPVDLHTQPAFERACALARAGRAPPPHPDGWFLAAALAARRRNPHPAANFPFPPSYGYHFEAVKLGAFLRNWAVGQGIEHAPLKVEDVERTPGGDVAALLCEGGRRIEGDLFVDCSGFRGLIAQETLGVPFVSFAENLFNDRAVVMPTPADPVYTPQTESIAMSAGWRWRIPLTTRMGNGYVYSSRYIPDEDAEAELRAALGPAREEPSVRVLHMKVGRVAETWHRNCLAAGLAQGFIEPLEATALHIVIATAEEFAAALEAGGFTAQHRDAFNASVAQRYDGIRDYVVAHYRFAQRRDTPYWQDNAGNASLSDRLKAMSTAWFTGAEIAPAIFEIYGRHSPYPSLSWHCLFAGYGHFPPGENVPSPMAGDGEAARVEALLCACTANFADLA